MNLSKQDTIWIGGLFVGLMVLISGFGIYRNLHPVPGMPEPSLSSSTGLSNADGLKLLKLGTDTQLVLRFNAQLNEAWVDPSMWSKLPYDRKEILAKGWAQACQAQGDSPWIDIKDNYSGEKLAHWGFSGFSVK